MTRDIDNQKAFAKAAKLIARAQALIEKAADKGYGEENTGTSWEAFDDACTLSRDLCGIQIGERNCPNPFCLGWNQFAEGHRESLVRQAHDWQNRQDYNRLWRTPFAQTFKANVRTGYAQKRLELEDRRIDHLTTETAP